MEESEKPRRYARDFAVGEVAFDHTDGACGLRALVLRGPFSFCAYVGVQADHTLAGLEELEFRCHQGITWQSWGDGVYLPAGWYWWGWDYGHAFDKMTLDTSHWPPELKAQVDQVFAGAKDWSVEEVQQDALDVLIELREQLAQSAELAQLALPAAHRPG